MLKAVRFRSFRAGLVKCALALTVLLWAAPAQAQEQEGTPLPCGPAEMVEEILKSGMGVTLTEAVALQNGWVVEIWEGPSGLVDIIMHTPTAEGGIRCRMREPFLIPLRQKKGA
jgi:hypothetical protein